MSFFTLTAQTSPTDLRNRYRELSKRFHPDKGGSVAVQAQINVEYERALKQLAQVEKQRGNIPLYDKIMRQMENHIVRNKDLYNNIYNDIKTHIPAKYHGLIDEFFKLIITK